MGTSRAEALDGTQFDYRGCMDLNVVCEGVKLRSVFDKGGQAECAEGWGGK